jgi:hypothetical protein
LNLKRKKNQTKLEAWKQLAMVRTEEAADCKILPSTLSFTDAPKKIQKDKMIWLISGECWKLSSWNPATVQERLSWGWESTKYLDANFLELAKTKPKKKVKKTRRHTDTHTKPNQTLRYRESRKYLVEIF